MADTQTDVTPAVDEHMRHHARYATVYDGRGGVKWQDNGGLSCSCDWSAPPDATGIRPWGAWHEHVVRAVLAAAP